MDGQEATQNIDAMLLPFLQSTDEAEAQRLLTPLISSHAEPIIKEIIGYKLRVSFKHKDCNPQNQDAEDVYNEALLQVLEQLDKLKAGTGKAIANFRSYVATVTYHICYEYLRQKYPQRSHLKDRLRYLFTHHKSFALWESGNDWLCGFSVWQAKDMGVASAGRIRQLYDDRRSFEQSQGEGLPSVNLADLVAGIFNRAGRPVELDDLINIASDLLGIREHATPTDTVEEESEGLQDNLADSRVSIDIEIDQRNYLKQLWLEICQLPSRQSAALLLNLRDEQNRGIIALFPLLGIATMDRIAEVLEISVDKFAELWNELPLDDAAISRHLGVTRQQVINLRKSARERLERRMKAFN